MHRDSATGNETARYALGRFLRERREAIAPAQVGILSHRGRRTPGLRREEVAFLADIGVKWYARLEAGDEIHPSESTLTGIAMALQLSAAELEYILQLAGLRQPLLPDALDRDAVPAPMPALMRNLRGTAAWLGDRILTPLHWNDLGDALYNHSARTDPVERNMLVRCLFDRELIELLGSERDAMVTQAVGMFRLNYASEHPSPFASAVYERVKVHPVFQEAWNRRIVAGELAGEVPMTRHHKLVGRLTLYAVHFSLTMRPELVLRAMVPADDETAAKFKALESRATDARDRKSGKIVLSLCN